MIQRNHKYINFLQIFGKTMENVEKRRTIHLFTRWDHDGHKRGATSSVASGYLKRVIVFDDNLIACEMQKTNVRLNKPIQVGFIILEHSKLQMYEFNYDIFKPMYPSSELLYMDTDSLIYNVKTKDFYADLKQLAENNTPYFDTSNFGLSNPYEIPAVNNQRLGTMKDELKGKIMTRFIGLSPKCYCYETQGNALNVRAKGVQRKVAGNLTYEEFEACLNDPTTKIIKQQRLFRSHMHIMYTEIMTKIALNGQDTKRFVLDDGTHTLAWGHYKIMEILKDKFISNTL